MPELAGTCGTLPEPVGTVGTFGSWSFHLVALAPSLRFCFHTDLPFLPQPPAPLQPTGGKQLMFALFGRTFAGTLPEPVGTVGTFGSWSFYLVALAPSLRFCFHTDLPFRPQPPAPLQPTGGKHLMFALFSRNFAGTSPELVGTCRNFRVVVISSRSPGPLASLLLPH